MYIFFHFQAAEKFKEPEPVNPAVSDTKVEAADAEESDDEEVRIFILDYMDIFLPDHFSCFFSVQLSDAALLELGKIIVKTAFFMKKQH